jgi:cyclopropane fatty-acyl-phospholipid synthase-like methyltransferase
MQLVKPYVASCESNRGPILGALRVVLAGKTRLLEIGSGTGQHAVYLAPEFPGLIWQTSDLAKAHPGIRAWLAEAGLANVLPPLALDVCKDQWPTGRYDAVFSANTAHWMSWTEVRCLFSGVGSVLEAEGVFCLYGAFNYRGDYTSESNARFDRWLRARDPSSGIRDFEAVDELAREAGLILEKDYEMPANNRMLVWSKQG